VASSSDEIKEREIGWACCTYGEKNKAYGMMVETSGRNREVLGIDGCILKCI
jgi:uncharacterized metal-binding protein